MKYAFAIILLAVAAFFGLGQPLYSVDETEIVIVTRLGQYQRTHTQPGLQTKTPFLETVHRLEKRLLRFDAPLSEFLTQEKKALVIDSYARYRIVDARTFFEKVATEAQASARLEAIVTSELREEVATHDQIEVIRDNREALMADVTARADIKAREFGMQVVDVRIVRADFPTQVSNSVYNRMRSERVRIANRFRAEGSEEGDKIRGDAEVEQRTILAEAEQAALETRGEGEAEAIRIQGEAINKDREFFNFVRTLEAYTKALNDGSTFVVPANSDFYQYLSSWIAPGDR